MDQSRSNSDQELYDRLACYTLAHHDPSFIHQYIVDAYGAQRADENTKPIDEGDITLQFIRSASAGLEASLDLQKKSEKVLRAEFPEIREIFSKIGTAEIATDPMGPNVADTFVLLHPRERWRTTNGHRITKEQLAELMQRTLVQKVPGQAYLISQPIQMRSNEIMAGALAMVCMAAVTLGAADKKRVGGPKGGRLLEATEPKTEFLLEKDRTVTITFYDATLKPVSAAAQSMTMIAEARNGKTTVAFEKKGDVLVSKTRLPEGDGCNLVVQFKQSTEAKPQNFRFKLETHACSGCKRAEYACTCDEWDPLESTCRHASLSIL